MRTCLLPLLLGLLLPLLAWGQAGTPTNPATPVKAATATANSQMSPATLGSPQSLPPSAPVITVAGVCADGTSSSNCSATVTRKEFEELVEMLQPEMASTQRQSLAVLYSQLLVFANAAQREGLDKTPEGEEALHFARLQALSQVLTRKLQAEVSKVSADDVQKFYREHPKDFEEGTLERLYVPRSAQAAEKPVKEEDVRAEMAKLRVRAVQGENFGALQEQAYADLGLTGKAPATQLQKVRREGLSSSLAAVFDQQFGVVSEPVSEASGLYIFRLISKRELSPQEATPEITRTLQTQRLQQALQQITASAKATFDSGYFGVAPKPKAASAAFSPAQANSPGALVNGLPAVATKQPIAPVQGTPE